MQALLLGLGYEPDLRARRLRSRADRAHLAALRRRPPGERLALAISANRLALRLQEAGRRAGG